jgi:hypothetical protein
LRKGKRRQPSWRSDFSQIAGIAGDLLPACDPPRGCFTPPSRPESQNSFRMRQQRRDSVPGTEVAPLELGDQSLSTMKERRSFSIEKICGSLMASSSTAEGPFLGKPNQRNVIHLQPKRLMTPRGLIRSGDLAHPDAIRTFETLVRFARVDRFPSIPCPGRSTIPPPRSARVTRSG